MGTTGIGDGGNEVGMGTASDFLTPEAGCVIPNVDEIACVTKTDFLVPCSVSNWGGYALSGMLAGFSSARLLKDGRQPLDLLPYRALETELCRDMVAAGARDGVQKVRNVPSYNDVTLALFRCNHVRVLETGIYPCVMCLLTAE